MRVVNLTVHRNNRQQRERKKSRKVLVGAAKDMANSECVAGFYLVSWDESGDRFTDRYHDPKGAVGRNSLPSYVEGSARRLITERDREE